MSIGLISSGVLATTTLIAGIANTQEMLLYFAMGSIGSLLPDIDSDNSLPIQVAFTLISILTAFAVMFSMANWFSSVAELLVIWLAVFLLFRSVVFALFAQLTTHRGIFHSIPAAAFFGFCCAIACHEIWALDPIQSWISGLFIAIGFMVHLALDEIYSVNLFGLKSKKSFGTAMKLYYSKSWASTAYMYIACMVLFFLTPELPTSKPILQPDLFLQHLHQNLFPTQGWFTPQRH